MFHCGKYDPQTLEMMLNAHATHIPWIPVDPISPDLIQYPRFTHAHPITVILYPGDALYLPPFWFHRVSQIGKRVIAVNWWYDVQDGWKWWKWRMVERVKEAVEKELP